MAPPLRNLKLLDLSRQLPGPFCSMMLADLGVDVLVVAAPNDAMGIGIPLIQRNKRSMTLNLKNPEGKQIFERLVAGCRHHPRRLSPGRHRAAGHRLRELAALNPRLIYCSISGYGQDGPYRDKVGHDINYLGYAGVLGVSGAAGGPPTIMPVQVADIGGGALDGDDRYPQRHHGARAYRPRPVRRHFDDGRQRRVERLPHHAALRHRRQQPQRGGTRLTGHNPCYAVYETKDGKYVTVGALEEHFWRNLCVQLGVEEFIPDQFTEGPRREEMFRVIRAKFKQKTQAEWLAQLDPIDICFGPVNTIGEALRDPQVHARGIWCTTRMA